MTGLIASDHLCVSYSTHPSAREFPPASKLTSALSRSTSRKATCMPSESWAGSRACTARLGGEGCVHRLGSTYVVCHAKPASVSSCVQGCIAGTGCSRATAASHAKSLGSLSPTLRTSAAGPSRRKVRCSSWIHRRASSRVWLGNGSVWTPGNEQLLQRLFLYMGVHCRELLLMIHELRLGP